MYGIMIETDYAKKKQFNDNFWAAFKEILGKGHVIKSLEKCDFRPMYEHFMAEREAKKALPKEVKIHLALLHLLEPVYASEALSRSFGLSVVSNFGLSQDWRISHCDRLVSGFFPLCNTHFLCSAGNQRILPPHLSVDSYTADAINKRPPELTFTACLLFIVIDSAYYGAEFCVQ